MDFTSELNDNPWLMSYLSSEMDHGTAIGSSGNETIFQNTTDQNHQFHTVNSRVSIPEPSIPDPEPDQADSRESTVPELSVDDNQ